MAIIRANAFDALINGTASDDTILANRHIHFVQQSIFAGEGHDTIDYTTHLSKVSIFGEGGNDIILSGSGGDTIIAGGGHDFVEAGSGTDTVQGGSGNDHLYGQSGTDSVEGGSGNDYVSGNFPDVPDGDGFTDFLWGDSGVDTFDFQYRTLLSRDVVMDFDRDEDYIDAAVDGSRFNYLEAKISSGGYQAAEALATKLIDEDTRYAFITDGKNGYLFADQNNNDVIDSCIEMRGLTSLSQFSWVDIA